MNKKLRVLVLIISLAVVYGTMGWVSFALIKQAERTEIVEKENTFKAYTYEVQQIIDLKLYQLLIEEQTRDYYLYQPSFAASRIYNKRISPPTTDEQYEISPLTSANQPYVKAFFQIDPNGTITGPALPQNVAEQMRANKSLYRDFLHFLKQSPHRTITHQNTIVQYVGTYQYTLIANQLWLLRSIHTNNGIFVQGALIDQHQLLLQIPENIRDSYPEISLVDQNIAGSDTIPLQFARLSIQMGPCVSISILDYVNTMEWALIIIWIIILLSSLLIIWVISIAFKLEKRQGAFVSAVTHELRTPLTTFSLYTELLEDGLVPENKKQEYYATMQRECKRLNHLIENVLAYSKLQNKGMRRNKDTVTCEELFDPIADKIRKRLEDAGFSFIYALSHQVRILPIKTDAIAIEQIIDNLAGNAIKYAHNETPQILMTVQSNRNQILVRFKDSGPGIASKDKKSVFKPFERTKSADLSKKTGIGLGLSFARDTARSLGGDLTLEQGNLKGACFLLTLPRS